MSFSVRRVSETRVKRRFPWRKLPLVLSVLRPLLHWYGTWKARRAEEERHARNIAILKRVLLVLFAVLCAVLLLAGTVRALLGLRILTVRSLVSIPGVELPKDERGFTNVLLLGVGDRNHDGTDLTDTIIVASIDPGKTKSIVLLSLPRDLYFMKTDRMGKGRLNELYRDTKIALRRQGMTSAEASQESMKELAKETGKSLNLTIHHVIKVDFTAFVKAVDAIDGIDITVPYDIEDTEYPDENWGVQTFSLKAGPAHLDGETALKYARSRHTTSDFDRSERQQQLLVAIGDKVKQQGLLRKSSMVMDLWKIFSDHVEMTMSTRELLGFGDLAEDISPSRVIAMQLNDRNGLYDSVTEPGGFLYTPPRNLFDGASVLLPVSIPEYPITWKQVHTLASLFFEQRTPYLARPTLSILNAGAKSGLARKLANELIRYGWQVEYIANAKGLKQQESLVAPLTANDRSIAEFFGSLLKIPVSDLPAILPAADTRQVTIILGQGYSYTPLQNLLLTP